MKLTIIEDIKKLTIEEAMKDNYFLLEQFGTALSGSQLFRLTLEDMVKYSENENVLVVRVD